MTIITSALNRVSRAYRLSNRKKLPPVDEHDEDFADVDQESYPHEEQADVFRDLADKSVQRFANNIMDQGDGCGTYAQSKDPQKIPGWLAVNRDAESTR